MTGLGATRAHANAGSAGAFKTVVGRSVAVVVDAIAYFWLSHARTIGRWLIDGAIAVVVDTIADFDRKRAAHAARIARFVVDAERAVVVHAVARIAWVGAQGICRHAVRAIAIERIAFVDTRIAVIVLTVAKFDQERVFENLRESKCKGLLVGGEVRRGAASGGNFTQARAVERSLIDADADGVGAYIKAHAADHGGAQLGSRGNSLCVGGARLGAVRNEHDVVRRAGARWINRRRINRIGAFKIAACGAQ